jgi:hypothetical protein
VNEQPTKDQTIRCPSCGRKLGEWMTDGLILMSHADGSALGVMHALGCTRRCGGVWRPLLRSTGQEIIGALSACMSAASR